jgi:hypothetical protein
MTTAGGTCTRGFSPDGVDDRKSLAALGDVGVSCRRLPFPGAQGICRRHPDWPRPGQGLACWTGLWWPRGGGRRLGAPSALPSLRILCPLCSSCSAVPVPPSSSSAVPGSPERPGLRPFDAAAEGGGAVPGPSLFPPPFRRKMGLSARRRWPSAAAPGPTPFPAALPFPVHRSPPSACSPSLPRRPPLT